MLPKNLSSSYQQYKNDTDTVASWLATTAKRFGFVSETKSKSAKKRGKAKKAENGSHDSPQPPKPTPQGRPTYTIAIRDFTVLAEFIASKDQPPIQVPPRFASLLDRAITTRQWFADAISPHLPEDGKNQESEDRHAFFLGVLKQVRDILKPRMPKGYTPKTKQPKSMKDMLNMFENLDLEETSEAFENAPDVVTAPLDTVPAEANYKAEQLQGIEEDFLAFQLLLADLVKLRSEINRTWHGYKQGLFELVPTSIMTNTAIDLARAMEEDLKEVFSKHGGTEDMLPMFYAGQCIQAGTRESYRERPGDEINYKMYDVAESIFWVPYLFLASFCDVIEPNHLPEYKTGYFGTYDPKSDRSRKTKREKVQEDKVLLLSILPEFYLLCIAADQAPAEDELTRGLRIMFKTKKVPLWLAFATQIFLDIHHILRYQVDYCFKKLADTSDLVLNSIKANFEFHKDLRIDNWPNSNDEAVQAFVADIKTWVQDDPHRKAAIALKRKFPPQPFWLFRHHPWYCGLWKYYIQIQYQEIGITFVGAWGSVMYCGHLYNAVRFGEKMLRGNWKDMDLMFMIQNFNNFFVGNPPHNPEDYLKRFCLAIGYSAASLSAKNKRKKRFQLEASKRGPLGLKEQAPVAKMFKDRYCEKNARTDLTVQDVEKILEKGNWEEEEEEEGVLYSLSKDSDARFKNKRKSRHIRQDEKPHPTRILMSLRHTLQVEMMELSFDYLLLHRFCWRLLRSIRDQCRDRLIQIYGPSYLETESQLPYIVGYIFMAATKEKQIADFLKPKNTDEVTSELLSEAAFVLEGMIEAGASGIVCRILEKEYGLAFAVEEE
ncbi:hypothetical protein K469DRAFT_693714 [Zopfia rhizophila CBS 207.26]|uniref:DUF6604 domain-containing protein n=1 Tax=Zopfia rhizophila CBS 207.26 TaxID=1314779 RepID=A0A6A6DQ95_9PEZI|nr:hypothetical protein K469DRAFT_693714 [Zopfia rhizophila CBS 207.26]